MFTDEQKKKIDTISTLNASLLTFTQVFFKLLTGNEFKLSNPLGRESHFITITRELTHVFRNPSENLIINVEPGSGKSTLLSMFNAWGMSQFPDSQYMYISYSKELASKHTDMIRRIIQLDEFYELYGVKIRHDARGKEYFETVQNGSVAAAGSQGTITGLNAGRPQLERWSGCLILDDLHKPDEVHSTLLREKVITNYQQTIAQRVRGINVPIIFIGQRLHESDICNFLLNGGDGRRWRQVVLKSLDDAGNALYPEKNPKEYLLIKQEKDIYTFASQFQQDPQPAGGSLFKEDWFHILDEEPLLLCSFITVDGAESSKTYNDATVFTFWGLYEVLSNGKKTGRLALHVLDCWELWIEPKDIMPEFMRFYHQCMLHKVPPKMAAIEKKSSGTFLVSMLSDIRGLEIREIERTRASGSKSDRFISMQPYIASKDITLPYGGKHTKNFITHMSKITANETHARDDICDTVYDAIKIGLMDKSLYYAYINQNADKAKGVASGLLQELNAREKAYNYDVHNY